MNIKILEFAAKQIKKLNDSFYENKNVELGKNILDKVFKTFHENYPDFKTNNQYAFNLPIEDLPEELKNKYIFIFRAEYEFLKETENEKNNFLDNRPFKGYLIRLNFCLIISKYNKKGELMADYDYNNHIEKNILRIKISFAKEYKSENTGKKMSGYKDINNYLLFKHKNIKCNMRPYLANLIIMGRKNPLEDILAQLIFYSIKTECINPNDNESYTLLYNYVKKIVTKVVLKSTKLKIDKEEIKEEIYDITSKARNCLLNNYMLPLYTKSFKNYLSAIIKQYIKVTINTIINNNNFTKKETAGYDSKTRSFEAVYNFKKGVRYLSESEKKHAEMGISSHAFYKRIQRKKVANIKKVNGKFVYDDKLIGEIRNNQINKIILRKIVEKYAKKRKISNKSAQTWLRRQVKNGLSLNEAGKMLKIYC